MLKRIKVGLFGNPPDLFPDRTMHAVPADYNVSCMCGPIRSMHPDVIVIRTHS